MKSLIEKSAQTDLEGAASYYELQQSGLGNQFLDEFAAALLRIESFPSAARKYFGNVRSTPLKRFPFNIYYYIDEPQVRVLAVGHKRRRPEFWKGRR